MKTAIRWALSSCLLHIGVFANAEDGVSVRIEADGGGRYYAEEYHPTRYDYESGTFCAGRAASSQTGEFSSKTETRTEREGNWTLTNAVPGELATILNQQMSWSSSWDNKDYVFHVKFKRQIGPREQSFSRSTACNTHTWTYKLDRATAKVEIGARVRTPENVWLVNVKPVLHSEKNLTVSHTIYNVARISGRVGLPAEIIKTGIAINGQEYFFVNPNEDIQILVSAQDSNSDIAEIADFEVTFVGYNRCAPSISAFKKISGYDDNHGIDQELVQKGLSKVNASIVNQLPESSSNLMASMMFLGCLTNSENVSRLLYDNGFQDIDGLIRGISDFSASQRRNIFNLPPGPTRAEIEKQNAALEVLVDMSTYALGRSALNAVRPYCSRVEELDPEANAFVAGRPVFLYFREKLENIGQLLSLKKFRISPADRRLDDFYSEIARLLEEAVPAGMTFAEVLRDRRPQMEKIADDFDAYAGVDLSEKALSEFKDVPRVEPTRQIVKFSVQLQKVADYAQRCNKQVRVTFMQIGQGKASPFTVDLLKKTIADLRVALDEFEITHAEILETLTRIGDSLQNQTSPFQLAFGNIDTATNVVQRSLNENYGGFLSKFVKLFELSNLNQQQMQEEWKACLYSSISAK